MGKLINLTGQKFNRLTVLERTEDYISPKGYKQVQWLCKCDCGNIIKVMTGDLKSGHTKSCGCLKTETIVKQGTKHGKCHTRLYGVFSSMHSRCYNENSSSYKWYGKRGICVCDEWHNFEPFYEWAIKNGYNDSVKRGKCTLERKDIYGDYSPNNCYWTDMITQNNNKSSNHLLTYNGKTQTIAQWSRETGIDRHVLYARVNKLKWSDELAITTPVTQLQKKTKNKVS